MAHLALDAWFKIVVYEFAADSGNGKFPGGIDVKNYHIVKQRKCIGELLIEVSGTAVQMRLENSLDVLVLVKFLDAEYALPDFFGWYKLLYK